MVRETHLPINSQVFPREILKKATTIRWWEKLLLFFVKRQRKTLGDYFQQSTLVYKELWGRTFIIAHFWNPPQSWNCRCHIHLNSGLQHAPQHN